MHKHNLVLNIFEKSIKIIKKKNHTEINIFNKIKIFKLILEKKTPVKFNPHTFNLNISLNFYSNAIGIVLTSINDLLFSLARLWHVKMKFMGKGFKIKRRRRTKSIKFFFYYSHLNVIILKKAKIKQRKKNKFIIKTWNHFNIKNTANKIKAIKPLNVYTKRGIRSSKQVVFKKTGKKSNY